MVYAASGPEDGLNSFVLSLAIRLTSGKRLPLASIYLGFLFHWLDEYVGNIGRFIGRFYVMAHANTAILQLFLR